MAGYDSFSKILSDRNLSMSISALRLVSVQDSMASKTDMPVFRKGQKNYEDVSSLHLHGLWKQLFSIF